MADTVLMPRQGQSVESCILTTWKVAEGDTVSTGDVLCEVETDKASFEVEATSDGAILKLLCGEDDDVPVLDPIVIIGQPGEPLPDIAAGTVAEPDAATAVDPEPEAAPAPAASTLATPEARATGLGVSPRARKKAEAAGFDASTLAGTGPGGRVIERDVDQAIAAGPVLSPVARQQSQGGDVPASGTGIGGRVLSSDLGQSAAVPMPAPVPEAGEVTEVPVKGIRKVVAERMHSSLQNTAQLTLNSSADARSVLGYRKKLKGSEGPLAAITVNDLILFAVSRVLPDFPELNAHYLGDKILQYGSVDLGFAVDTPRGLMVPVVRGANQLTLQQLATETKRLISGCLEGNINPDDLSGGTFTVTNLGAMGIETFTPVLNAPQVGILGVGAVKPQPVMKGDGVDFVPHMSLSLTFDHCATDGAPAARFVKAMADALRDFDLTLAL